VEVADKSRFVREPPFPVDPWILGTSPRMTSLVGRNVKRLHLLKLAWVPAVYAEHSFAMTPA
jgi:hypothetical protein